MEPLLTGQEIAVRLGIVLLLVIANAFFVAAEFALVSARRTHIEALARKGNRRARLARSAINRLDHYISGTQLGITLASLGLGWVGESTLASLFDGLFDHLPDAWQAFATHGLASAIAFATITFLHIVFGELAPKSLALLFPEGTSMWTAGPLIAFSRIGAPFIFALNGAANLVLRAVGLKAPHEAERVHRPEELEMLLTQSEEHGLVAEEPAEMIRSVFGLADTMAGEIMTPRTEMVAVSKDSSLEHVEEVMLREGHSRIPIYEGSLDEIVGVVLSRDVWRARRSGNVTLAEITRQVPFVPDTKPVEDLLRLMQEKRVHLAVVIDEFGGTAGVVTTEDIIEEIVGEIEDEHELAEGEIEQIGQNEYHLLGSTPIYTLNDRFEFRIPEEDYTTVAGFVLASLGRMARVGDEITFDGGVLHVLEVRRHRIVRIRLTLRRRRTDELEEGLE